MHWNKVASFLNAGTTANEDAEEERSLMLVGSRAERGKEGGGSGVPAEARARKEERKDARLHFLCEHLGKLIADQLSS
jgi:hypothetical protein